MPEQPAVPAAVQVDVAPAVGTGEVIEIAPTPAADPLAEGSASVVGVSLDASELDPPKSSETEFTTPPTPVMGYRVTAVSEYGFWRLGRKFLKKPTIIPAAELDAAQTAALMRPELKHVLKVELIEL